MDDDKIKKMLLGTLKLVHRGKSIEQIDTSDLSAEERQFVFEVYNALQRFQKKIKMP